MTFRVTYEGPLLDAGMMPVTDLAPALLSLGQVFTEASKLLYPDQDPVGLNIKATRKGSFDVHLVLDVGDAWHRVVEMFSSDGASAVANLLQYIGGASGVIAFVKWVGGRRVKAAQRAASGEVVVLLEDGEQMSIAPEVLALYEQITVRQQIRKAVEPLTQKGIEQVEFRVDGNPPLKVVSADVPAFDLPSVEEPLLDEETEMVLSIVSVVFSEGNKWRFTAGDEAFSAAIEDAHFVSRIEQGVEAFRHGDMMRCRVRVVQSRKDGKLHIERTIVKVVKHIPRQEQLELGAAEEDSGTPPEA